MFVMYVMYWVHAVPAALHWVPELTLLPPLVSTCRAFRASRSFLLELSASPRC